MADLPFLKNKNKKRDGATIIGPQEDGSDLLHKVTDELIEAIDKKDLKSTREALRALVLIIKEEDRAAD